MATVAVAVAAMRLWKRGIGNHRWYTLVVVPFSGMTMRTAPQSWYQKPIW